MYYTPKGRKVASAIYSVAVMIYRLPETIYREAVTIYGSMKKNIAGKQPHFVGCKQYIKKAKTIGRFAERERYTAELQADMLLRVRYIPQGKR